MIKFKVTTVDNKSCFIQSDKYETTYPDNTVMSARIDTLGFFLFDKKSQAESFRYNKLYRSGKCKIKRVETLDRGKRPPIISSSWMNLDKFYMKQLYRYEKTEPPLGTSCHFKIRVLEDCKS